MCPCNDCLSFILKNDFTAVSVLDNDTDHVRNDVDNPLFFALYEVSESLIGCWEVLRGVGVIC